MLKFDLDLGALLRYRIKKESGRTLEDFMEN